MELLVIAGVAFLLGWGVISVLPKATAYVPATLQTNKWAMIFTTGALVMVGFFAIAFLTKKATGRTVPV